MKINQDILSIPPYISTAWKNISALHLEEDDLVITLQNGAAIKIPNQSPPILEEIFTQHACYIEEKEAKIRTKTPKDSSFTMKPPIGFNIPLEANLEGMMGIGNMMQHNPDQANSPILPEEILKKVADITKVLGIDDTNQATLPRAEPHCNCFHCQIARAMTREEASNAASKPEEELVDDEDLKFKEWDIEKAGDQLYSVKNPLNPTENYQVFLGAPIGCTCGEKNCEHIKAVLRT